MIKSIYYFLCILCEALFNIVIKELIGQLVKEALRCIKPQIKNFFNNLCMKNKNYTAANIDKHKIANFIVFCICILILIKISPYYMASFIIPSCL